MNAGHGVTITLLMRQLASQRNRVSNTMAKGYWIAHVRVTDPERYKDYVAANAKAFEKYNAKFLVRGGESEVRSGEHAYDRHVVLEFESYDVAKACYDSPEYKAATVIRNEASDGYVVVIKGYDG